MFHFRPPDAYVRKNVLQNERCDEFLYVLKREEKSYHALKRMRVQPLRAAGASRGVT